MEREGGVWAIEYLDTPVLIITDARANRIRVMTPVIEAANVTDEQWAAIADSDLRSAISQVVVLSKTFGSTYNSAGLTFGDAPARPVSSQKPSPAL